MTLNDTVSSLHSRYAVSVVWKLDSSYNVKDVWYGRTVIRSKYKLTYEVAQKLFNGAAANDVTQEIPELLHSPLSGEELEQRCVVCPRLWERGGGKGCDVVQCIACFHGGTHMLVHMNMHSSS